MTAIDTGIQKSLSDDDPQTLDLIYDAYGDLIFGYINCLVCSRQDAEDCFQNLFIRIVNKRHLLKGKENLKAYLMTMARNEVMEFFRKKKQIYTIHENTELRHANHKNWKKNVEKSTQNLKKLCVDDLQH